MASISVIFLVFAIIAIVAMLSLLVWFVIRFFVYGYIGNVYIYIVAAYLICLMMSLVINFNPIPVNSVENVLVNGVLTEVKSTSNNVSYANPVQAVGASLFEALRMMPIAFDKALVSPFFSQQLTPLDNSIHKLFGSVYYATSAFALITTSIGVILFFAKSFFAKLVNLVRSLNPNKEVYYIFSESKVAHAAKKLARVLKAQKHIVVMYVTKASLKTQDGTEYRDALINEGLDVKNEAFSEKLASFIFSYFFNRTFGLRRFFGIPWLYRNRKVTIYGIFDDDESAVELANNFRKGIAKNFAFYKNYNEFLPDNSNINEKSKKFIAYDNNERKQRKHRLKAEKEINKKIASLKKELNEKIVRLENEINEAKNTLQGQELEDKLVKLEYELSLHKDKLKAIDELDDNQKKALRAHEYLKLIEKYRIFVTYQDYDIDLAHNFSGQTLHIINTLSQYDMVSSEFILNNPIVNFLPMKEEMMLGKKVPTIDLNDDNADAFHVSFLGFGSINRPIFDKMTQAYQLWDDFAHKIHYHIYDYKGDDIVAALQHEYLEKVKKTKLNENIEGDYFQKPQLYEIDAICSGQDLTSYHVLDNNVKELMKDSNRFKENGFEIFVISARSSNSDIQIAKSLRHILMKNLKEKALKRAYIFVRIGNEKIAKSVISENSNTFFSQETFNDKKDSLIVPIIIFGEHTNMSDFIDRDYETLVKLGRVASGAYAPMKTDEEIEFDWLRDNKTSVLNNIATIYSLKTKLNIIGYDLEIDKRQWSIKEREIVEGKLQERVITSDEYDSRVRKLENEVDFMSEDKYDVPMMKLARVEHNRWLATNFTLYKTGLMSKKEYALPDYAKSNKAKTKGRERHACMTTNKGLRDVYTYAVAQGLSEDKAMKLCYTNDIAIMKKVFQTIIELQEKERKNGKK